MPQAKVAADSRSSATRIPGIRPRSFSFLVRNTATGYHWRMKRHQEWLDRIHAHFQDRTDNDLFSGVVRITQGDRELFAAAYGLASRSWQVANTMETRFDTASLTKLFTSISALQLVDTGKLTLDTQAIPYLELENTTISDEVTLFQLLTHSSGIGDDAEEENGEDYEDLWINRPNYSVRQTADFLPQFATKAANFPPGEGCRYCNCGFILAGLMIEKATQVSFREYVHTHIFEPAGMTDSGFFSMDTCTPNVAEGADPIKNEDDEIVAWKKNIYSYPPIGSPDSGAYVTAADLDRFLRAVKDGSLVSSALAKQFFTPQVHYKKQDGWDMKYGLGMWFYVEPDGTIVCCQKEGYNAGVSAILRCFPTSDMNLVILSNMADGAWEPAWAVHKAIVDLRNEPS